MIGVESELLLGKLPHSGCFLNRREVPEIFSIPINSNVGKPTRSLSVPTDAGYTTRIIPIATGVAPVFPSRYFTQIAYAVVIAGPINVINFYGPVSVDIEPNYPMDEVGLLIEVDDKITVCVTGACFFADIMTIPSMYRTMRYLSWLPAYLPSFRVDVHKLAQPFLRHEVLDASFAARSCHSSHHLLLFFGGCKEGFEDGNVRLALDESPKTLGVEPAVTRINTTNSYADTIHRVRASSIKEIASSDGFDRIDIPFCEIRDGHIFRVYANDLLADMEIASHDHSTSLRVDQGENVIDAGSAEREEHSTPPFAVASGRVTRT